MRLKLGAAGLALLVSIATVAAFGKEKPSETEIRVRLLNAHSGKPYVGVEVELYGDNGVGLLKKDVAFHLRSKTDSDGIARFAVEPPLPPTFVLNIWQVNGCIPFDNFRTEEVVRSGIVARNTCPKRKYRWQDVKVEPGEIVIFALPAPRFQD